MWPFDVLLALLLACAELDVGPLLLILAGFPVYRVVHQLEELIFEVVLHSCAQRRILRDIRGEATTLLEAKHPLNINQPHPCSR